MHIWGFFPHFHGTTWPSICQIASVLHVLVEGFKHRDSCTSTCIFVSVTACKATFYVSCGSRLFCIYKFAKLLVLPCYSQTPTEIVPLEERSSDIFDSLWSLKLYQKYLPQNSWKLSKYIFAKLVSISGDNLPNRLIKHAYYLDTYSYIPQVSFETKSRRLTLANYT